MILVYSTIPDEEIRSGAEEAVANIGQWFKDNPRRQVCKANCWYGRQVKVRKGRVREDIEAARDLALKSNANKA